MNRANEDSFARAYQEWHLARADVAKINADGYDPSSDPDGCEIRNRHILDRAIDAERRLAVTPARTAADFVTKFEVLEAMISEREREGPPADHRHLLMLASVKADLYEFDLTHRPAE